MPELELECARQVDDVFRIPLRSYTAVNQTRQHTASDCCEAGGFPRRVRRAGVDGDDGLRPFRLLTKAIQAAD